MRGEVAINAVEEDSRKDAEKIRIDGIVCWNGHTRGERYLTLALTTVLFVAVLLAFSLASYLVTHPEEGEGIVSELPSPQALLSSKESGVTTPDICPNELCCTKECVDAAALINKRMNESANPCDDFVEFACGKFIKETFIPDEKSSVTMFSKVSDELDEKLRTLVQADVSESDSKTTVMAKNLYQSCMDRATINANGLEPLKKIHKQMGGWPVVEGDSWNEANFSWMQANYINRKIGYSIDYLFDFSVSTDIRNSTWRMIWLDQPSMGMSREYLMKGLNDSDVQAYLSYSTGVAKLLGANSSRAEKEMKEVLQFQIAVANISLPREKRRNMTKLYNTMSLANLTELVPEIPWVEYTNNIFNGSQTVSDLERIGVSDPKFFTNLMQILETTPKRVVANYILWRVASASASYISDDIRNLQLEYSKKLTGKATRPPRWKECMGLVSGKLSFAIANLYVKNFFNEEAKMQAEELVTYIKNEFDVILNTIDWMDEKTRIAAKDKAKAIRSHIGYPDELLMDEKLNEHYGDLLVDKNSLLDNMRRIGIFGTNYSFSKLRLKVDKLDWKRSASVAVVNAYYSSIENSIKFPAGILQGVFFKPNRPRYLNFGGIGFVIGHEITHGFDDQGKQFDKEGNLFNWWEKSTEEKFLKKAKCIIEQYGNYTAPENGMKLNGINTQGENIADNGGIKEAYHAYQKWTADHKKEPKLPSVKYSPNQLFWISAAQVWCSKYRPQSLKVRILTGVHSPGRFRVVGPFGNSHEFSKDWNCSPGSYMNPVNKCTVW